MNVLQSESPQASQLGDCWHGRLQDFLPTAHLAFFWFFGRGGGGARKESRQDLLQKRGHDSYKSKSGRLETFAIPLLRPSPPARLPLVAAPVLRPRGKAGLESPAKRRVSCEGQKAPKTKIVNWKSKPQKPRNTDSTSKKRHTQKHKGKTKCREKTLKWTGGGGKRRGGRGRKGENVQNGGKRMDKTRKADSVGSAQNQLLHYPKLNESATALSLNLPT